MYKKDGFRVVLEFLGDLELPLLKYGRSISSPWHKKTNNLDFSSVFAATRPVSKGFQM
jgi:hypothetical protein